MLLPLELASDFSLKDERVMQQSSVSISLSFEKQGINPVGDYAKVASHLHKTNKKLATNAIKGLSIPSRSLTRVRSDRDNKINIFSIFVI